MASSIPGLGSLKFPTVKQNAGPRTTATSALEGRLKVIATANSKATKAKKIKILKKSIKKVKF